MIQRIQSLYLAIIVVLSLLLFLFPLASFHSGVDTLIFKFDTIQRISGSGTEVVRQFTILPLLIAVIPVISIVTILLYKKRHIQMVLVTLSVVAILLFIFLAVLYGVNIYKTLNPEPDLRPGLTAMIPIIMLIFNALAYKGIKKDEELVRSFDRLR